MSTIRLFIRLHFYEERHCGNNCLSVDKLDQNWKQFCFDVSHFVISYLYTIFIIPKVCVSVFFLYISIEIRTVQLIDTEFLVDVCRVLEYVLAVAFWKKIIPVQGYNQWKKKINKNKFGNATFLNSRFLIQLNKLFIILFLF